MESLERLLLFAVFLLLPIVTSQQLICYKKIDIVFVVDNSGSITDANPTNGSWNNWVLIRDFIRNVVTAFNVSADQTRIGLLTFGNYATIRWKLNTYSNAADIISAVYSDSTLPSGNGETNLYDGLQKLNNEMFSQVNGGRLNSPHVAIVLTDGFANLYTAQTIPAAQTCWSSGIQIFTIGITSKIDENQLKAVSSPPHEIGQNYWTTPDFTTLSTVLDSVQQATCNPPKANLPGCQQLELAILFSIPPTTQDWTTLKTDIKQYITSYLNVAPNAVRISMVTYNSYSATVQFSLNAYSTEDDVKTALDNLSFDPVISADPTFALQLVNRTVFNISIIRSDIRLAVLLFTQYSASNLQQEVLAASALISRGVNIVVVGLSPYISVTELRSIASPPSAVLSLTSFSQLIVYITNLGNTMCSGYSSEDVTCPRAADIILMLDQSTSIVAGQPTYDNWYVSVLGFAVDITDAFPISDNLTQIGVLKFSDYVDPAFGLTAYHNKYDLQNAIKRLDIGGGETNIAAALRQCQQMLTSQRGARNGVPKIAILVTDGAANREADQTIPEANKTKAAGIEIYTVGITSNVDVQQLRNIASPPWETHYFYVADYNQLNTVLQSLVDNSCKKAATLPPTTPRPTTTRTTTTTTTTTPTTTTTTTTTTTPTTTTTTPTTTTTTPTTTPTTTTTTTTTSTTTPTTTSTTTTPTTTSTTTPTTTTTTTTTIPTTTTTHLPTTTTMKSITTTKGFNEAGGPCRKHVDVVFVLDVTSNINFQYFQTYYIPFLQSLAEQLEINTGTTRVAAVSFNEVAQTEFYFNNFTTAQQVRAAFSNIRYGGYRANLSAALALVQTVVFTSQYGARLSDSTVSKLAVIITDNPSSNKNLTLSEAWLVRRAGIGIITIGVGTNLDLYELTAVASYPYSSNMMSVSTIRNISLFTDRVKRIVCSDDSVCSSTVCQSGGTCVESVNQISCQCTDGHGGNRCQFSCLHASDVIFALDASGSIELTNFQLMTSFVGMIIESLFIDGVSTTSRVGLLTFSDSATVQFNLNTYTTKAELLQAVNVPYMMGSTNTAQAIQVVRDVMFTPPNGNRSNVPNYLVILTDGLSNNTTQTWKEAMTARNQQINIITIGIGNQINVPELVSVASSPASSNVLLATNFTTLNVDIRNRVAASLCANDNECSSAPCQNRATCVDLTGGYTCSPCPESFTGFNCERACSGRIDLTFILDSAGTVHAERWHFVTEFVTSIVNQLDVGIDRTRVAAIYYSDTAYVGFLLNQYYVQQDVVQAVTNLPYIGGRTNTSSSLNLLKSTIYQSTNGDRSDVWNIAVLITNGESTVDAFKVAPVAAACRNAGMQLITVAAESLMSNSSEMLSIASDPISYNMFVTPTISTISSVMRAVLTATCNSVNECLSSPCQNGGTCVNDYGRYFCQCRRGFTGYHCQRSCSSQLDVVFILDISGSIQQEYLTAMAFAKSVVYGLDVDSGNVRIGAVGYSSNIVSQFYLNDYIISRQAVVNALRFYNIGGTTNTAAALTDVINNQFTPVHGARDRVTKVAILVSDGNSNVNADQTVPKATELKNTGVTIYSVANGDTINMSELTAVASSPDTDYVIEINNDVNTASETLLDQLCV